MPHTRTRKAVVPPEKNASADAGRTARKPGPTTSPGLRAARDDRDLIGGNDNGSASLSRLDLSALNAVKKAIVDDPGKAHVGFGVSTEWTGGARSESTVNRCSVGGRAIARNFTIPADEPHAMLGTDTAPNPQELLLAAFNACMTVGYVAQAALHGVDLTGCRIESSGEFDLRAFLELDNQMPPGCCRFEYCVTLEADAPHTLLEKIHQRVMEISPNYFSLSRPVQMVGRLT